MQAEPQEQTIEVNGVIIHYVKFGNGEHVVLPLPSSMATGGSDFFMFIDLFDKDKYTVILLDPIGRGKSRFPDGRDFIFNNEFRDIEAKTAGDFMEKLGIKRYSLLGGCYGGQIALKIAAFRKECVNKVIIWGTRVYVTEKDGVGIAIHAKKCTDGVTSSAQGKDLRDRLIKANGGEEHCKYLAKALVDGYMYILQNNNGNVCKEVLPEVEAEVLVLHGDEDHVCTLEQSTYIVEHSKRAKMLRIPNGGHFLQLRFPRQLYELIDTFLQSPL